jgi:hypothetical protein
MQRYKATAYKHAMNKATQPAWEQTRNSQKETKQGIDSIKQNNAVI